MSNFEFSSDAFRHKFYKTNVNSLVCTYYFSIILLQSRGNKSFKGKILQNIFLGKESFITDDIFSYGIQINIIIYLSIHPTILPTKLSIYLPINQLFTYLYLPT